MTITEIDDDAPIKKSAADEWRARAKASVQHLCDLKRHGYSPRRTELRVDRKTDRIIAMPIPSTPRRGRPKATPIVQVPLLRRRGP